MLKAILATGPNGELGFENSLPWNCPEDLQYFKKTTLNKPVIMGYNTFKSLPFKDGLPKRANYVLTTKKLENTENVQFITNKDLIRLIATEFSNKDVFIIGGKQIYDQLIPFVNEIHRTIIIGEHKADVYIDLNFLDKFNLENTIRLSDEAIVEIYLRK